MDSSQFGSFGTVSKVVEGFRNGLYGQYQAAEIAATLVEGHENIRVVARLLSEIHADGRKLDARSCPLMARRE